MRLPGVNLALSSLIYFYSYTTSLLTLLLGPESNHVSINVVLPFESVDEILVCDNLNEKLLSRTFMWYCLFLIILENEIHDFSLSFELKPGFHMIATIVAIVIRLRSLRSLRSYKNQALALLGMKGLIIELTGFETYVSNHLSLSCHHLPSTTAPYFLNINI